MAIFPNFVGMTKIIMTSADAGYLEINTGNQEVSEETRNLCANFWNHYHKRGIPPRINILNFSGDTQTIICDIVSRATDIDK